MHHLSPSQRAALAAADQTAAAASATGYTLALAIASAFTRCDIGRARSADDLLFDAASISCQDALGRPLVNKTGYSLVLESLSSFQGETFFGPVEFNRYRRNVAKSPVVLQVQKGQVATVLPLDAANKQLVMPNPRGKARTKVRDGGRTPEQGKDREGQSESET